MAAFLGFGLLTFGIGVFVVWGTAGSSLISEDLAEQNVWSRIEALEAAFGRLEEINVYRG
jgi:hypothetical protein